MENVFYCLINKNLGAQAIFLGAQKDFVVVNRGGGGGRGEGDWEGQVVE